MMLLVIAAACSPQLTGGVPITGATTQPTDTPVALSTPNAPSGLQQSIVLSAPQMKMGSVYRYFDGALLDAVPNTGPFLMGSGSAGDNPRHSVTLSDYWIYSTKVTNQMYAWCVSLGKCTPPGNNHSYTDPTLASIPIVGVSWQQASDYCSFAHGSLPTEAQWEKAASWDGANNVQRLFPWGNNKADCDLLNFKYCVNHLTPVLA